jgi:ABC-2 type transport system ATP-binding protein
LKRALRAGPATGGGCAAAEVWKHASMSPITIQVAGLVKRFGAVRALDGIDFDVEGGAVFGLLGPNGAGKTTAVRILATILRPDAGSAQVLGFDVARRGDEVRRRIGLAGQNAAVDANLTGSENLRLIGRLTHLRRSDINPRAQELLRRFDLADAAHRPVRTYSGGMRRRLDLAAALVHNPPVLFFDEPTTGLDPESRAEMWQVVRELTAEGTTVVLTTQYLEEADQLAHRIVVIDHGRVVANDTPAGLKSRLGSTVVEIGMADARQATQGRSLLTRYQPAPPDADDDIIRLSTTDGAGVLVDVLRTLDAGGIAPQTMSVREPSLDDVFLALVGRHATDDEPPALPAAKAAGR